MVVVPGLALSTSQGIALIRTLERMATRKHVTDETHLAEAISFVAWDGNTGLISDVTPDANSHLHISQFSPTIYQRYIERYKGLPPHD